MFMRMHLLIIQDDVHTLLRAFFFGEKTYLASWYCDRALAPSG